jgi:predicted ATPase
MHDAISWSYDMLEPDERGLFTALSVLAGSFDLRSAEAMAPGGDTLDLLTRLTERSMLAVRPQAGWIDPLRAARDAPGIWAHPPQRRPSC